MPRTPEANQRLREAQRTKILASARSVFARKGMEATITDIAAEAQISLGLAYRYFADKEAIFSELVKQTVPDDSEAWPQSRFARSLSDAVHRDDRPRSEPLAVRRAVAAGAQLRRRTRRVVREDGAAARAAWNVVEFPSR